MSIRISGPYHHLRDRELELTVDFLEKQAEEKEREEKVRLREERKAQMEMQRERERLTVSVSIPSTHWPRLRRQGIARRQSGFESSSPTSTMQSLSQTANPSR